MAKRRSQRQKEGAHFQRGNVTNRALAMSSVIYTSMMFIIIYFSLLGTAVSFSQAAVDFIPMFPNLENFSSLGLFVTSCGEYLSKPSLGKSYTLHFFKHRCTQGFETDLEICSDGGECHNSGRKHDLAKC